MTERDAAAAVVRDFENIVWLTLLVGLVGCALWRFFFPKETIDYSEAEPAEGGAEAPVRKLKSVGVPVDHFSAADLVVLPMVLIKYSMALILFAAFLFSLPDRLIGGDFSAPVEIPGAAGEDGEKEMKLTPVLLGFDLMLNIILLSLVMTMIQWVGRRDPMEVFGLRRLKWHRILLWVICGAAIATPIVLLINMGSQDAISRLFGEELKEQAAVESIKEASDTFLRVLLIANACIVAPVVEEVIFRGYLYGVLKKFTGPMFAAFIGASLFAVAHNHLPAIMPLWGFGLLMTLFYEGSRCLWVPIGMHAVYNAVQMPFLLNSLE